MNALCTLPVSPFQKQIPLIYQWIMFNDAFFNELIRENHLLEKEDNNAESIRRNQKVL